MSVRYELRDRVVVVTGAASGIGEAIARGFAEAEASVHLLDIDAENGPRVASAIHGSRFVQCDLTSEASVAGAIDEISAENDHIDVLVNNAGGFGRPGTIEDTPVEEWRALIEVNLTSVFLMTRAALPLLRRSGTGRIINLGSLAAQTSGWRTSPAYVAAKGGVHALTRALAWELAGEGITVNTLSPTAVLTERIDRLRTPEEHAAITNAIPLGRYQTAEEVAHWALFLASDEAGFMTGQVVAVNGGRFMA